MLNQLRWQVSVEGEQPTKKESTIAVVVTALQGLMRFLITVIVGRLGGVQDLGNFASANAVNQLGSTFGPTTIAQASSRFTGFSLGRANQGEVDYVVGLVVRFGLVSSILVSIGSGLVWHTVFNGSFGQTCVVALASFGLSMVAVTRSTLFGALNHRRVARCDLLVTTASILGALVVMLAGLPGVMVLLPIGLAMTVYGLVNIPVMPAATACDDVRRKFLVFCALNSLGTICSAGFVQLGVIHVAAVAGTAGTGLYAAALALTNPITLIVGSLISIVSPRFAFFFGKGEDSEAQSLTDFVLRIFILVGGLTVGLGVLLSDLIIGIFFGSAYAQSSALFVMLLSATVIRSIASPAVSSLNGRSNTGLAVSTVASASGLILGVIIWSFLIPNSVQGAASGFAIGTVATAVIIYCAEWKIGRHDWLAPSCKVVFAAGLILSLYWAAGQIEDSALLTLAAALFVIAWLALNLSEVRVLKSIWGDRS